MPEQDNGWSSGAAAAGITTIGDDLLRRGAECVDPDDDRTERVLGLLTDRLRSLQGAGLAAPQVGLSLAIAVVEVRRTELFPDRPESPLISLVNPAVTAYGEEAAEDWEGCFSVPGLVGRVRRPSRVTVEHLRAGGAVTQSTFEGYLARVVQHEIDHLQGVLYVDKLTSPRSLCTIEHYRRTLSKGVGEDAK